MLIHLNKIDKTGVSERALCLWWRRKAILKMAMKLLTE